jgi:hypothetical protein
MSAPNLNRTVLVLVDMDAEEAAVDQVINEAKKVVLPADKVVLYWGLPPKWDLDSWSQSSYAYAGESRPAGEHSVLIRYTCRCSDHWCVLALFKDWLNLFHRGRYRAGQAYLRYQDGAPAEVHRAVPCQCAFIQPHYRALTACSLLAVPSALPKTCSELWTTRSRKLFSALPHRFTG